MTSSVCLQFGVLLQWLYCAAFKCSLCSQQQPLSGFVTTDQGCIEFEHGGNFGPYLPVLCLAPTRPCSFSTKIFRAEDQTSEQNGHVCSDPYTDPLPSWADQKWLTWTGCLRLDQDQEPKNAHTSQFNLSNWTRQWRHPKPRWGSSSVDSWQGSAGLLLKVCTGGNGKGTVVQHMRSRFKTKPHPGSSDSRVVTPTHWIQSHMTSSCGSGAPWQEGTTRAVFDAFLGRKRGPAVSRGPALQRTFTKAVSP